MYSQSANKELIRKSKLLIPMSRIEIKGDKQRKKALLDFGVLILKELKNIGFSIFKNVLIIKEYGFAQTY